MNSRWLLMGAVTSGAVLLAGCGGGSENAAVKSGELVYDRCKAYTAADVGSAFGESPVWPDFGSLEVLSGDISDHWILKGMVSGVPWACVVNDVDGTSEIFAESEAAALPLNWYSVRDYVAGEGNGTAGGTGSRPVSLQLVGSATGADVTLAVDSQISQQAGVLIPFQRSVTVPAGTFVQISGQNTGESGTITCQILQGGKVLSEQTSTGAYVIASCGANTQ